MQRDREDGDSTDDERVVKRQRLSSPTYDNEFDLSQEQVAAFDAFERKYSQHPPPLSQFKASQAITASARKRRDSAIVLALSQHARGLGEESDASDEDPSTEIQKRLFTGAAQSTSAGDRHIPRTRSTGFASALHATVVGPGDTSDDQSSSLPRAEDESSASQWFQTAGDAKGRSKDDMILLEGEDDDKFMDDWFAAAAPAGVVGFQTAKLLDSTTTSRDEPRLIASVSHKSANEDVPAFVGFRSGSSVLDPAAKRANWIVPSEEALRLAAAKMEQWDRADQELEIAANDSFDFEGDSFDPNADSPLKQRTSNRSLLPSSLVSARQIQPIISAATATRTPSDRPVPIARVALTVPESGGSASSSGKKPFKPPLLAKPPSSTTHVQSPLVPEAASISASSFAPASRTSGFHTPVRPSSGNAGFVTPAPATTAIASAGKVLGLTAHRASASTKPRTKGFVTPFKAGFRPGEPGRAKLVAHSTPVPYVVTASGMGNNRTQASTSQRPSYFDLDVRSMDRKSLLSSGLRPQQHMASELEAMGIDVTVLSQMTPETAYYYLFNSADAIPDPALPPPPTPAGLGAYAAYVELKNLGCKLATREWVNNHWCLILWKLAGMVCLEPEAEADPARRRWCWREVMRQLRYRYERELNRGQRPPLRRLVAQDASAAAPMVLCISSVTWPEGATGGNGTPVETQPGIVVTDGWYRLDAELDEPLRRAVRAGRLRAGHKIAVMNCKLTCDGKEGGEILEIGSGATLSIYANSSHLAPWHARLGFQKGPFVAALGSLDPFGGVVPAMDVTVVKAYPVAYLEFVTLENGQRIQEGPRNERDEAAAQDEWERRHEKEAKKLREEYDVTFRRLADYADQLERKAATSSRHANRDDFTGDIDDVLMELEDAEDGREIIRKVSATDAGPLARALRDKMARDQERIPFDIERELKDSCPPREVRSFRIVVVRDSQTVRRPAQREAQITVWDVLSIQLIEDEKPGDFKPGQRLMVTNLYPSQPRSWMTKREDDSVIYLATRKQSTWTLLSKH